MAVPASARPKTRSLSQQEGWMSGRLQIQHELGAFGARAADQEMRLARRLVEDRVAMIDLALDIARQARAAVPEFAGAACVDPVPAQHIQNRLARWYFILAAALCQPHEKRPVVFEPRRRRRAGPSASGKWLRGSVVSTVSPTRISSCNRREPSPSRNTAMQ